MYRFGRVRRIAVRRRHSTTVPSGPGKLVLGCGSNVVDNVFKVRALPKPGEKGFFECHGNKILQQRVAGGVTLNHLAWAALFGVPTGLLGVHGNDEASMFIRASLQRLGISPKYISVEQSAMTGQCHVMIDGSGERSIVMAPGATSMVTGDYVARQFRDHIRNDAMILTTEISQVPLSGVISLLGAAKDAGILTVLDLDTTPEVALGQAMLGSEEELIRCVKMADILKPAKGAADDMLAVLTGSRSSSPEELASCLVRECGSQLVAITHGSKSSILATNNHVVEVPTVAVDRVIDTTGAGDAFLGGIIGGIVQNGMPRNEDELMTLGRLANSFGAACVQDTGGTPTPSSRKHLIGYLSDMGLGLPGGKEERCQSFQESLRNDSMVIQQMSNLNYEEVDHFVDQLVECEGHVFVSGVGKSGIVAERLAVTLSSVGVTSSCVHAAEWGHGNLGAARPNKDVVVFLSHSGETEECVVSAQYLTHKGVQCLGIIGDFDTALSSLCRGHIHYGNLNIVEKFGVIPTGSIIVQELISNAILYEVIERKKITKEIFTTNHLSGAIGRKTASENKQTTS